MWIKTRMFSYPFLAELWLLDCLESSKTYLGKMITCYMKVNNVIHLRPHPSSSSSARQSMCSRATPSTWRHSVCPRMITRWLWVKRLVDAYRIKIASYFQWGAIAFFLFSVRVGCGSVEFQRTVKAKMNAIDSINLNVGYKKKTEQLILKSINPHVFSTNGSSTGLPWWNLIATRSLTTSVMSPSTSSTASPRTGEGCL